MRRPLFLSIAFAATVCGCAGTGGTGGGPREPAAEPRAATKPLPDLRVVIECGQCAVPAHIPGLVLKGYRDTAAQWGFRIIDQDAAVLTIKSYTARPAAERMLFGALAGKDEIVASLAYAGREFVIEDYFRNAWFGIDSLAEKIGALAYDQMKVFYPRVARERASARRASASGPRPAFPRALDRAETAAHLARYSEMRASGMRPPFTVTLHPGGRVERECERCPVPYGEGTLTLHEDGQICFEWAFVTYPVTGCFRVVQRAPDSFEMRAIDGDGTFRYSVGP
jgi:hypothetical protein